MADYCVFFDLDETLINCKSLIESFRFFCENEPSGEFRDFFSSVIISIREMQQVGVDRNSINKSFYRFFKGISKSEVDRLAEIWFLRNVHKPGFLISPVVDILKKHQKNQAKIVIVSGSYFECVRHIANYFGVEHILCVNLEEREEKYTGNIFGIQPIGYGKLLVVENFILQVNGHYNGSYAYCDHESDLPLLMRVEHPVVVGNDAVLWKRAIEKGWEIIQK